MPKAAVLDVDGTLVDATYHHAVSWHRAFRSQRIVLPMWRIHRVIGMGGDFLVRELCGEQVENEKGDALREAEKEAYFDGLIDEVEPLAGARELIDCLHERGQTVVLASSAKPEEVDRYLDWLEARELVAGWTTSGDVDASKPAPDVVEVALSKVPEDEAVLVGDSVFDCESAAKAGIETLGVLTGGFAPQELHDAGASRVFFSLEELIEHLDETPLAS